MAVIAGDNCLSREGSLIPVTRSDAAPAPLLLGFAQWGQSPVQLQSLGVLTQFATTQQVAAQFQNTLGGLIFVTPFGDAPGAAELTFLANRKCRDSFVGAGVPLLKYYKDWRLQPQKEATKYPAIVAVGDVTFRAFITGMSLGAATSAESSIIQGKLQLTLWLGEVPQAPEYGGTIEWGWLS
jgi:hypothetical protein